MDRKIIHISHTDLDGYGCHLVTKKLEEKVEGLQIEYHNVDYGDSMDNKITEVCNFLSSVNSEYTLLVSDLNLSEEQAIKIDEVIKNSNGMVEALAIDHHLTGKEVAKNRPWYKMVEGEAATKLVFEFFKETLEKLLTKEEFSDLENVVTYVDVLDLWRRDSEYFNRADYLSTLIYKDIPPDEELARDYRISIVEGLSKLISKGMTVEDMENNLPKVRQEFINYLNPKIASNKDKSFDKKLLELVYQKMDFSKVERFYYDNKVIALVNFENSDHFAEIAKLANDENEKNDFTIIINVKKNGRMSGRSLGKTEEYNASKVMKTLFGGGGHFNAAGGSVSFPEDFEFNLKNVNNLFSHIASASIGIENSVLNAQNLVKEGRKWKV